MTSSLFNPSLMTKSNTLPANGVDLIVFLSKIMPKTSEKAPIQLIATPLTDALVHVKKANNNAKKKKNDDSAAGARAGGGVTINYSHTEQVLALRKNEMFKMFNCPVHTLVIGGVYHFKGVTLNGYVAEVDSMDPVSGLPCKIQQVRYSLEIAQIFPTNRQSISDLVGHINFSRRSIDRTVDIFNPDSLEPYDLDYTKNKALVMKLMPYSQLPNESDWFPNQPNETIMARFPLSSFLEFEYIDKENPTTPPANVISGKSNSSLQLFVNQRDSNGEDLRILVCTKVYSESIMPLQCPHWSMFAKGLVPHLTGQIIGTIHREKTTTVQNYDKTLFPGGALFMYNQFVFNVRETIKAAIQSKVFGIKVDAELAAALVDKFYVTASPATAPSSSSSSAVVATSGSGGSGAVPQQYLFWVNALNLCSYGRKLNHDQIIALGESCDFYCISTNRWKASDIARFDQSKSQVKDVMPWIMDKENALNEESPIIVYVYCALKDEAAADAMKISLEETIRKTNLSIKQTLIAAAAAVSAPKRAKTQASAATATD
jgi:hypothetical protein